MEDVFSAIMKEYGTDIWLTFVTFVLTGFIMVLLKGFVADLVNFFKARMSDIGYGQRILWEGQIYIVEKITFRHIVVKDDRSMLHIPIDKFMSGVRAYPIHRYDDFTEAKYLSRKDQRNKEGK